MTRKRVILLVSIALLATGVLATVLSVHGWHEGSAAVYDPAGTWMGTNNYGSRFTVSVTPWSPDRKRITIVADAIGDMSWLGAVAQTKERGWGVRTGRNTYEHTMVALGVDEAFNVVYILRARFTTVLTDPNTGEYGGTAGYYAPDQDPFGEEPPALACIPVTGAVQRVPMLPPCEL